MGKKIVLICLCIIFSGVGIVEAAANDRTDAPCWEKHLEFSYVNTSGNTDTISMSLKSNLSKEGEKRRYYIKGNALFGEDNDEETQNKWSLDLRGERTFTRRLFGFLSANYMDDRFSGYDYRAAFGPGLGYDVIKSQKHALKALLYSLYYYDQIITKIEDPNHPAIQDPNQLPIFIKTSDNYVSGKIEIDYTWRITKNLKLKEIADYLVSTDDKNKYFLNSETALQIKVNKYVSLGVSYTLNYQNLLPSLDKKHTDTTFLTSLIIDF